MYRLMFLLIIGVHWSERLGIYKHLYTLLWSAQILVKELLCIIYYLIHMNSEFVTFHLLSKYILSMK